MSLLVLSAENVAALTNSISAAAFCTMLGKTMSAVSGALEKQEGVAPIQNPLRIATESELHKNLYMPSRLTTSDGPATAIKVVGVPKPNCKIPGLPATTLLFDESTGLTRAVVNAAELTGIRTAAASALATKILADPSSTTLVVFGSGTQSYYHARLILELFPSISTATFVVRSLTSRSQDLVNRARSEFGKVQVEAVTAEKTAEVVRKADIVCTCVPSTEPLFEEDDLKENVHITAIGSYQPHMFEFPPSLIAPPASPSSSPLPKIPTILVDSLPACLSESGELITSNIQPSNILEIGALLDAEGEVKKDAETKELLQKLRARGRSLFKCVGVGGMDVAITRLVVEEAEKRGVGQTVPF
ncbi:hypothetical protein JCM6882_000764 [Rhodosporidiobolus microsporus]